MVDFAAKVLPWFDKFGRHDLPWQQNPTPYRVWVSEIMLQQTQVATVIPYYRRFMARFPGVAALANADIDQVLHLWTGLGYYARARNLHRAAQQIEKDYCGEFPADLGLLETLPGIGRSTAGAIAALSMGVRAAVLDGNVKRVLARYYAIEGYPEQSTVKRQLWKLAEELLPEEKITDYTQGMMDLGSTICTRSNPVCGECPLNGECEARKLNLIYEIPGRKLKKSLPVKSVHMYIVQNDRGEVFLQRRPPSGIWGGLYSFPEMMIEDVPSGQSDIAPGRALLPPQTHDGETWHEPATELPQIRHSFSHYHLDITPVLSRFRGSADRIADSDESVWYPLDHSLEVGLAAPVKKILSQLKELS